MLMHLKYITLGFCALVFLSCGNNNSSSLGDSSSSKEIQYREQECKKDLSNKERRILSELTASSDAAIERMKLLLKENTILNQSSIAEIYQNLSLIPIPDYAGKMTTNFAICFSKKQQHAIDEMLSLTESYLDLYCKSFGQAPDVKELTNLNDRLISPDAGDEYYAFYLSKGDSLVITLNSSAVADYYLYDYNANKLLKKYRNIDRIGTYPQTGDVIPIDHNSIYLFRIVPKTSMYVDAILCKRTKLAKNAYTETDVDVTSYSECKQNDVFAVKYESIDLTNILEEPRKVTLRSVIKSTFSGETSSVLALPLPRGTTDVAYQLRLSRKDIQNNNDGQFFNNFQESYKKINVFGIPVYDKKEQNTSLIREILNGIVYPPREEDAYCNLYVYYGEDNFNSGLYDKDYSITQVQSTNGRIPANGCSKIYLKFDNVQMRHDIYIWVEAIATIPTEYYMQPILKAKALNN